MIYLGADHRGYVLKEFIKEYFSENNIEYTDYGTDSMEIAHYPLIVEKVCTMMNPKTDKAILICGSGIGMSIVANKYKGIRAGICGSIKAVEDGKGHDNINVLILPAEYVSKEETIEIIKLWMTLEFLNGRYLERIKMIEA